MFPISTFIWIIVFGVILAAVIKMAEWYTKKTILNVEGEISVEAKSKVNKIFTQIKTTAVAVWIVVTITLFYLTPWIHQDPQIDVGSEVVLEEVRITKVPTPVEVETSNEAALAEPERVIEESVIVEQKKSKEDFDAFLKKSLEGVK